MNARNVQRNIRRVRRMARAFTLVEMLICVGAVGLIAVGLGKLFSSTGDTVKVGKRLSYMNELATTLENRIRKDLAAATRDGPMVIRHKTITTNGGGVLLSADDRNPAPRFRRADEITFLAQGRFTSAREPMWPGRAPVSTTARVYLGHGMVRSSSDALAPLKLTDDPSGTNSTPPRAWPAGLGEPGPNQYASDWILLRHVTVLARPQLTQNQVPAAVTGGQTVPAGLFTAMNWTDSPSQIQLQPAAPSVFRFDPANLGSPDRIGYGYEDRQPSAPATVAPTQKSLTPPTLSQWVRPNDTAGWPQFASGLVDVASIDPQMIRTRILGVPWRLPFDSGYNPALPPKLSTMQNTRAALESTNYTNAGAANTFNPAHLSKMLMAGMLPGADPWIYNGVLATPRQALGSGPLPMHEHRMICAAKPPDFTGHLSNGGMPWAANEPYHQQDQAMLSASNLAVGCSEFTIEWSFGDVYPAFDAFNTQATGAYQSRVGQLIWHGRAYEGASSGLLTTPYRGETLANPVGYDNHYDAHLEQWVRSNGTTVGRILPGRLVHWPTDAVDPAIDIPVEVPLYSFFGYVDPTFTPAVVNGVQVDPDTVEWPWPKLLRFTIGLTDPNDPNFEQTYQFVVELPTANQRQ
jgi:type II secretory pathway pseudopilin PulG